MYLVKCVPQWIIRRHKKQFTTFRVLILLDPYVKKSILYNLKQNDIGIKIATLLYCTPNIPFILINIWHRILLNPQKHASGIYYELLSVETCDFQKFT